MNIIRLAVAAVVAAILMLSTGSLAHAATDPYPVKTPTPSPSIAPDDGADPGGDATDPNDNSAAPGDGNGILPSTGGVGFYLLILGSALVVAGGGAVYVSRRRHVTAR